MVFIASRRQSATVSASFGGSRGDSRSSSARAVRRKPPAAATVVAELDGEVIEELRVDGNETHSTIAEYRIAGTRPFGRDADAQ